MRNRCKKGGKKRGKKGGKKGGKTLEEDPGPNGNLSLPPLEMNRKFSEIFEFESLLEKPGKQGVVGICREKESNHTYVFKFSQTIDYLIQHEYWVSKGLDDVTKFCPNFCRTLGLTVADIDPTDENRFCSPTRHRAIETDVLIMEKLKAHKLATYIENDTHDRIIYSAILQVLFAIQIAYNRAEFTHYDLHSNNVMLTKCSKNTVFLYRIKDPETGLVQNLCVPSFGYRAVIIDFGFSYSKGLENQPLWSSMKHTDVGFTGYKPDPVTDSRLFLVTVGYELNESRRRSKLTKTINIVSRCFKKLRFDWDSGWDNFTDLCILDHVSKIIEKTSVLKGIFKTQNYDCLEILQTLITLPFHVKKDSKNYKQELSFSFPLFFEEFRKIEREIGSEYYCLYILKGIVDLARELRFDYISSRKNAKNVVMFFRQGVLERIDSIASYCNLKDLDYEKMLCSLYSIGCSMKGVVKYEIDRHNRKKDREYSKISNKNINNISVELGIDIDQNSDLGRDFEFNTDTVLFVVDELNSGIERYDFSDVSDERVKKLNSLDNICRGEELESIFNLI